MLINLNRLVNLINLINLTNLINLINRTVRREKEGLRIFLNEGKCADCHRGPHFAAAIVGDGEEPIESMQMQFGDVVKNYDSGFYNIGVSPTNKDLGIGGKGADGRPLSNTLRQPSRLRRGGPKAAVNGSFKVPTLRNIEYKGTLSLFTDWTYRVCRFVTLGWLN